MKYFNYSRQISVSTTAQIGLAMFDLLTVVSGFTIKRLRYDSVVEGIGSGNFTPVLGVVFNIIADGINSYLPQVNKAIGGSAFVSSPEYILYPSNNEIDLNYTFSPGQVILFSGLPFFAAVTENCYIHNSIQIGYEDLTNQNDNQVIPFKVISEESKIDFLNSNIGKSPLFGKAINEKKIEAIKKGFGFLE